MTAAGEGMRVRTSPTGSDARPRLMIVFHGRTSLQAGGTRTGRLVHWVDSDLTHIQTKRPDCQYAILTPSRTTCAPTPPKTPLAFTVTGSMPEFAEIRSLGISEGRFL